MSFNSLCDQRGSTESTVLNTEVWWVSQGKHLRDWVSSFFKFFHGTPSLLKRMTDRWTTAGLDLDNCQTFSQNWTKLNRRLQGNQLTEFIAMIKFKFTSKSWFRKPVLPTMSMTAFQYRDFSNRIVGDVNEYDFCITALWRISLFMNQYFPNH